MATVRFSKELQDEIIKRAKAMFDKQLDNARNLRPSHEWADKIYTTLFGQYVPALNAVPQDFLYLIDHIDVDRIGNVSCELRFDLPSKRAWVREFRDDEYAKRAGSYNSANIILKNHPAWEELFVEVKEWQDRIKAVQLKRDEFVEQVQKIITAHATLAPALKMWPPLWDLIPDNYKDKHREIKEREKKDVVVNVDLNTLTATVVANKLTR